MNKKEKKRIKKYSRLVVALYDLDGREVEDVYSEVRGNKVFIVAKKQLFNTPVHFEIYGTDCRIKTESVGYDE